MMFGFAGNFSPADFYRRYFYRRKKIIDKDKLGVLDTFDRPLLRWLPQLIGSNSIIDTRVVYERGLP
jgi:hypothetical protein